MKKQCMMVAMGCFLLSVVCFGQIQFISHAGDASSAPGHSMPAYKVAVDQKADFLKLDLRATRDDVIVMMHDGDCKRMMGLELSIRKATYQELLEKGTYKARGGFDKEKIVRLEDALELVKGTGLGIWMDPKGYSPKLVEDALSKLKERNIGMERLMMATFQVNALKYMKEHHPEVRRVLHVSIPERKDGLWISFDPREVRTKQEEVLGKLLAKGEELKLHGFNFPIWSPVFSREIVYALKAKGYWVSLWFVDDEQTMRKALDAGADAVVTDHLKVLKNFLAAEMANGK